MILIFPNFFGIISKLVISFGMLERLLFSPKFAKFKIHSNKILKERMNVYTRDSDKNTQ